MRLLHTSTLRLITVASHSLPPYAILSHTWGHPEEEYSFEDFRHGFDQVKRKPAFDKLHYTCTQARQDGLDYCWIDSICINKDSSAELQEAINSMFEWYRRSSVCYAYLSDVTDDSFKNLSCARWFWRGWTLQELIAPSTVRFYSRAWTLIGTKHDRADDLNAITNIPLGVLAGSTLLESNSVAQRMSWASRRETSRPEDLAYCLMGIFSINMPMLYGEGNKAFQRLQEEIIKSSDDNSIFAWRYPDTGTAESAMCGLLAEGPRYFSGSHTIQTAPLTEFGMSDRPPFSMTNRGIQVQAHLIKIESDPEIYAMVLGCRPERLHVPHLASRRGVLAILLDGRTFARVNPSQFMFIQCLPPVPRTLWLEPSGEWPDYADEYLSRTPSASRYSLATEQTIQIQINGQELLRKRHSANLLLPAYLSDASGEAHPQWFPIGWTASWNIVPLGPHDFSCLYFEREDGQRVTIQLGVNREVSDEGFGPEYFYRGYFLAVEGWHFEPDFLSYSKPATGEQELQNHRVQVFCEDVHKPSQRHPRTSQVELAFLIRVHSHSYGVRHFATCDNCAAWIYGTRYKCTTCDDFDYCSDCFKWAAWHHPDHQFSAMHREDRLENAGASSIDAEIGSFKTRPDVVTAP